MAAKTVEINDLATAKLVAKEYKVEWPEGRGKPPVKRLWLAIVAAGDTVTGTYVTAPGATLKPAAPGKREYDIARTVLVERKTSKGTRKMSKNETVRVSVAELRAACGHHSRGTLGASRIREALAKLAAFSEWTAEDIEKARVKPVEVTAATAAKPKAKTPAKASNGKAKGKPAAKAVESVSEPVKADTDAAKVEPVAVSA